MRAAIAVMSAFIGGCGPRVARPIPDEHRASVTVDASVPELTDAAIPSLDAASKPAPERLAWVNPSRCLSPCTYDPQARLVRVDTQGVVDPSGKHLVDRSVEESLRALVHSAHEAGHKIRIESAYRSYDDQMRVFRQTKQVGRAARPGHSEHQLGTAVDFRMPTTASIRWLAEHAPEHGFVLSYPDGKQRLTGYRPEPWHVRFVGPQLASELQRSGLVLEELFRTRPDLGESGNCDDCPQPASRSGCGDVTAAGTCDGTVLQWCYDDALASVDCSAFKQRCGRAKGADVHDCL